MRRASTYILLCGLAIVCMAASPVVAAAITISTAHSANGKSKISPKLGSIHMKLLGASTDELLTDGTRWAAYEPTLGVTRLMDTATGHTINRPDPEGCASGLVAIGGGEVMYECNDPECPGQERSCRFNPPVRAEGVESRRYVVENIVSGAQHIVPGTSRVPVGETERTFELDEIGSQWAGGTQQNEEYRGRGVGLFVNWHTGQLVYEANKPSFAVGNVTEEPKSNKEEVENLSSARLLQSLCAPLTRLINGAENTSSKYGSFEYEPPFAVLGPVGPPALIVKEGPTAPLQLRRCGSPARVILQGGGSDSAAQLGHDVLSWRTTYEVSSRLHGVNYVTHLNPRSRTWFGLIYQLTALPKYSEIDNTYVKHTGTLIFATVRNVEKTSTGSVTYERSGSRIYLAWLPWVAQSK
jgi:hypothetical protein